MASSERLGVDGQTQVAEDAIWDMTDTETAVETFLERADAVYEDYQKGYTDADAALSTLEAHVESLRETVE